MRSALLCGLRLVHLGESAFEVLDQLWEGPLYSAFPRDQNIIIPLFRVAPSGEPDRLLEPPARPVAHDRAPQGLGRGEAEAGDMRIEAPFLGRSPLASPRLQDERGRRVARSATNMQEFGAGLEASDGRHRRGALPPAYADRRLRPLARRLASTSRPPLVAMRARKP